MGKLIYGTAHGGLIRFSIIDSKDIVNDIKSRHYLSNFPTVVLGQLITASGLVIPWLSEKETITFAIASDGPAQNVVAQSNNKGYVRGYISNKSFEIEPNLFGKFNVRKAVGHGELTVVRDIGLKTPYVSKIPIISGEIAEDIACYYTKSEQIPTVFALEVLMNTEGVLKAGGLAIQSLSENVPNEIIREIEKRLKNFSITSQLQTMNLEDTINYIIGDKNIVSLDETSVIFKCSCNKEKAIDTLKLLELRELLELKKEGKAEVTCKWCNASYTFDSLDLQKIIESKKN